MKPKSPVKHAALTAESRVAAALRENLKKRKAQKDAREKKETN